MELLVIKDTVTLKDERAYVLATIPFSLEDKLFWMMVDEVRDRIGEEKFFWDGELRAWVIASDSVPQVKEILAVYYPQSIDSRVDGLRQEIRAEVKQKSDEEEANEDEWLTKPL